MKSKHLLWIIFFLITLAIILTTCREDATPTPGLTPSTTITVATPPSQGQAFLDAMQVVVLESFPVQVQVTISGNLSDACTSVAGTNVQRQDSMFVITVMTAYDETTACAQALVPFTETVFLDVAGLPAGTYTVMAGGLTDSFTLTADNNLPATPDLSSASLTVSTNSAQPGQMVGLNGMNFPANAAVEIGIGPVASEYEIIASTQAGAEGQFAIQVAVPNYVGVGQQWVFAAEVNNATVLASPITIVAGTGGDPGDGVNDPVNGVFTRTNIYLIALEDAGQSGQLIGCNDSVVPVVIDIEPTTAPMTAAINRLLSIKEQFYGQSGLYHSLYQSNLALQGINIVNREAIISLTGSLQLSGVCDDPRVMAQLEQIALQYDTVDRVSILLNGEPLPSQVAGRG